MKTIVPGYFVWGWYTAVKDLTHIGTNENHCCCILWTGVTPSPHLVGFGLEQAAYEGSEVGVESDLMNPSHFVGGICTALALPEKLWMTIAENTKLAKNLCIFWGANESSSGQVSLPTEAKPTSKEVRRNSGLERNVWKKLCCWREHWTQISFTFGFNCRVSLNSGDISAISKLET